MPRSSPFIMTTYLVDPTTHRITGIVDLECVSSQPWWKVARVPQSLDGQEVDDGLPMPTAVLPPDEGADEFHEELQDWL
ncbi:hypothetical protein BJV74DRAFT_840915 [Russula compacta]|nr:hypothetical protein BJV74DRAFT_840915 [Russula compacta]